jgi:uncharacterized RDD family membrane protein YckC
MAAGFLQRFLALVIDSLVFGLVYWLLSIVFGMMAFGAAAGASGSGDAESLLGVLFGGLALLIIAILWLFEFLYFGWLWSKDGQSLGMKVMNIRVERRDGTLQSFLRAGLRGTVGYWVSSLVLGLGFLWAAFDPAKEAWHDKLFETKVVSSV